MSDESDNESSRTASPEREEEEVCQPPAEPTALDVAKGAEVIAVMERVDGRGEPLILTWKEGVENRVEAIGTDPRSKLVEADPAGKVKVHVIGKDSQKRASRLHAIVRYLASGIRLIDVSTNGLWVGGMKVEPWTRGFPFKTPPATKFMSPHLAEGMIVVFGGGGVGERTVDGLGCAVTGPYEETTYKVTGITGGWGGPRSNHGREREGVGLESPPVLEARGGGSNGRKRKEHDEGTEEAVLRRRSQKQEMGERRFAEAQKAIARRTGEGGLGEGAIGKGGKGSGKGGKGTGGKGKRGKGKRGKGKRGTGKGGKGTGGPSRPPNQRAQSKQKRKMEKMVKQQQTEQQYTISVGKRL